MARIAAALKTRLNGLALYDTETRAIKGWRDAFGFYFKYATTATQGAILKEGLSAARSAMGMAMTGLSTASAAAIVSGITAFWNYGVGAPAGWWPTCTAIAPPAALATLEAELDATFAQNIAEEASKAICMQRIASKIHTACNGGTATFPGPVVDPIL